MKGEKLWRCLLLEKKKRTMPKSTKPPGPVLVDLAVINQSYTRNRENRRLSELGTKAASCQEKLCILWKKLKPLYMYIVMDGHGRWRNRWSEKGQVKSRYTGPKIHNQKKKKTCHEIGSSALIIREWAELKNSCHLVWIYLGGLPGFRKDERDLTRRK